tara:strand:- start:35 stop:445 length:411 start_codon:yes stop_codon:yes gene_type:complete
VALVLLRRQLGQIELTQATELLGKHPLKRQEGLEALMGIATAVLYQEMVVSAQGVVAQLMEVIAVEPQTPLSTKLLEQAQLFLNYLSSHQAHRVSKSMLGLGEQVEQHSLRQLSTVAATVAMVLFLMLTPTQVVLK